MKYKTWSLCFCWDAFVVLSVTVSIKYMMLRKKYVNRKKECKIYFKCSYMSHNAVMLLLYSIISCTFMALIFCQADSKAQHQNPIKKNHLSIVKSSTTETPDRVYAKMGLSF